MIFPLRVLGRASVKRMSSGLARAPISFATHLRKFFFQFVGGLSALLQGDERGDRLTFDFVGTADHGGFGDASVRDQRALHFHGAEAVAADVEHIVDAAHDPEISVLIFAGAVAGEIHARESATSTCFT